MTIVPESAPLLHRLSSPMATYYYYVRFSQKYPETQTTPKSPELVGKNPKPISGANVKPMANRGLHILGSN